MALSTAKYDGCSQFPEGDLLILGISSVSLFLMLPPLDHTWYFTLKRRLRVGLATLCSPRVGTGYIRKPKNIIQGRGFESCNISQSRHWVKCNNRAYFSVQHCYVGRINQLCLHNKASIKSLVTEDQVSSQSWQRFVCIVTLMLVGQHILGPQKACMWNILRLFPMCLFIWLISCVS